MLAGSNIIYPCNVGTPTGSLDIVNLVITSVLLRRNAKFVCFDIKTSILAPPLIDLSICASDSMKSPKSSLTNKISPTTMVTGGPILISKRDAMVYPKVEN